MAVSNLSAATLYVSLGSTNPTPPYATWATAATNIQDAVDAAQAGDAVLVTNGTYATGGRSFGTNLLVNRVAVDKPLMLRSVNGPKLTLVHGDKVPDPIRCVYLTNGASLSGFTLTNGATQRTGGDDVSGGGVWCASANAFLTNCVIAGNSASGSGGGAYSGTLNSCTLSGNSASGSGGGAGASMLINCTLTGNGAAEGGGANRCYLDHCTLTGNATVATGGGAAFCTLYECTLSGNYGRAATSGGGASSSELNNCTLAGNGAHLGGGAYECTLYNCTLTGNVSLSGGGAWYCTLYNCIVYFNDVAGGTLNYCCTPSLTNLFFPLTIGVGNITNAPLFVDYSSGNLRLQSNSPCINAGNNAYAPGIIDLDGRPRIVGGAVDIGAYEFQPGVSGDFIGWLEQYGLPTDGSADFVDTDGDGMNNWQEWLCGTCPTNPLSVLRLLSATPSGANVTVMWQSVAGVSYFLERSTNLSVSPPFTLLAPNLPGQPGTTSCKDTNATGAGPFFYRVGVKYP